MKKKSIFWGLVFVLMAAFIVVAELGFIENIGIWTAVFTVGFGAIAVSSIPKLNFAGILIPLAGICILYAEPWGITRLTPWPVLVVAVLGSIGLHLLFKGTRRKLKYRSAAKHHHREENFQRVIDGNDGNSVFYSEKFGSSIKYINSDDFENANLECSFGAMKVYFDNAIIQGETAQIYMDVSFAGVELYLPKGWAYVDETQTSLGSIEFKNQPQPEGKTVYLKGDISFGGVTVTFV